MDIDVTQIVREVIAELERRQGADAAAPDGPAAGCAAAPETNQPTATSANPRELVVCSRVVSLAEIGDRLAHIRRLVVPPGAVITPAARDALEDRNVALVFGPTGQPATATAAKLLLVTVRTTYDSGGLVGALRGEGINVESQTSDCLIRSVDTLAGRVADGATLGVLLTPDAAAAMCLANRLSGVRAVSATQPGAAVDAARAVGANVLVVDPRGRGVFQLKQLVSAFCRSGPCPCPEVLRARLG
jgi:hypothetical protein